MNSTGDATSSKKNQLGRLENLTRVDGDAHTVFYVSAAENNVG